MRKLMQITGSHFLRRLTTRPSTIYVREVRYAGKERRMAAAFHDKVRCLELLTKLLDWAEPTPQLRSWAMKHQTPWLAVVMPSFG